MESHPARGAWIEISSAMDDIQGELKSHPARGAWIEIIALLSYSSAAKSRTPQGVRGLKWRSLDQLNVILKSHPARGAWIEISFRRKDSANCKSHPARGAWIEISKIHRFLQFW